MYAYPSLRIVLRIPMSELWDVEGHLTAVKQRTMGGVMWPQCSTVRAVKEIVPNKLISLKLTLPEGQLLFFHRLDINKSDEDVQLSVCSGWHVVATFGVKMADTHGDEFPNH